MNAKPKVTEGAVGSTLLPKRWGYRPFQLREYADGLVMLVEHHNGESVAATVFVKADGLNGGFHRRKIHSHSDIGALYAGFRRGLTKLDAYPLFENNGTRRRVSGERPPWVHWDTGVMNLRSYV